MSRGRAGMCLVRASCQDGAVWRGRFDLDRDAASDALEDRWAGDESKGLVANSELIVKPHEAHERRVTMRPRGAHSASMLGLRAVMMHSCR